MHGHTNLITILNRCKIKSDDSIDMICFRSVHELPHNFRIMIIEEGVDCEVCLHIFLLANVRDFRQIRKREIGSSPSAHIELSHTKIHAVAPALDSGCQTLETPCWSHNFDIFCINHRYIFTSNKCTVFSRKKKE